MQDQHLTELLRELPREQARRGFTTRVLARLDDERRMPPRARRRPRLALAAVAALLVLTAGGVALEGRLEARRAARLARAEQVLRELRAEHGQIKRELESLPDQAPVFYLGGNEDLDLVVDLGEVRHADGVRPAAYRVDSF
jgi:hypothetical protein